MIYDFMDMNIFDFMDMDIHDFIYMDIHDFMDMDIHDFICMDIHDFMDMDIHDFMDIHLDIIGFLWISMHWHAMDSRTRATQFRLRLCDVTLRYSTSRCDTLYYVILHHFTGFDTLRYLILRL